MGAYWFFIVFKKYVNEGKIVIYSYYNPKKSAHTFNFEFY